MEEKGNKYIPIYIYIYIYIYKKGERDRERDRLCYVILIVNFRFPLLENVWAAKYIKLRLNKVEESCWNLSYDKKELQYIYTYILSSTDRLSFYQNSSVWLDTQDARSPGSKPVQLYVRLNIRPLGH